MRRFLLLVGAALALTLLAATAAFAKDGRGKPDAPAGDEPAHHGNAYGHEKHDSDSDDAAESASPPPAQAPADSHAEDAGGGNESEKGGAKKNGDATGPAHAHGDEAGHRGGNGKSGEAQHHVIICHRTGSATNPYVVINISVRGWEHGHSTHPELDGRGDLVLRDPARPGERLDASSCETGNGGGDDGDGGGGGDDDDGGDSGGGGGDDGSGDPGGGNDGGHEGGGPGGNAQDEDGQPAVTTSSDLPFTGVPTLSFLLIGFALLVGGLALRGGARPGRLKR